ncbi:hypothetical protein [Oceanobacillus kapialis]|uniref:Uncharacterized protein n=1 Tax=Oceanobacillus kapialis TaxID=481353 RepID=A0ABW5Q096_9BACI
MIALLAWLIVSLPRSIASLPTPFALLPRKTYNKIDILVWNGDRLASIMVNPDRYVYRFLSF